MTIQEAEIIRDRFSRKQQPTEEEFFAFTEAMAFLIEERQNPRDMMYLGGVYYGIREFDLALKYYEMAAAMDYRSALSGLGYIWYYGRTGEKDYGKAFHYFSRAAERGDLQCAYKVADMYKNGYYVERDYEKYKSIVKSLYPKVKDARYLNEPLPEVFTRLANIYIEENRTDDAAELFFAAKDFLAQRLKYNAFFGDLSIMSWLIRDLYSIVPFPENGFDFYDLYYLLNRPCRVSFCRRGKTYVVESVEEDGEPAITFGGKWYRTPSDFFEKAEIDGKPLTSVCDTFYMFEVRHGEDRP